MDGMTGMMTAALALIDTATSCPLIWLMTSAA